MEKINWNEVLENLIEDWYQSFNVYSKIGKSMEKINKQFNIDFNAIMEHMK